MGVFPLPHPCKSCFQRKARENNQLKCSFRPLSSLTVSLDSRNYDSLVIVSNFSDQQLYSSMSNITDEPTWAALHSHSCTWELMQLQSQQRVQLQPHHVTRTMRPAQLHQDTPCSLPDAQPCCSTSLDPAIPFFATVLPPHFQNVLQVCFSGE